MEWLKNLSKAIDYIEENLDKEISYDEVAKIACCSTFYFQRIFSYVVGISLSEYIRKRKMTQSAFELQRTNKKILDIALKYGYSSPTSFNRAFKSVHGVSPIAAKDKGCKLNVYPKIKLSVTVSGGDSMTYRIENKEEMRILGIRRPLVEDMSINQREIPLFWEKFLKSEEFKKICKLPKEDPKGILGLSVYKNPKEIYYYIGVSTNISIPEGMFEIIVPAFTWVVFENYGHFKEDVQSVFRSFYTEWLPFSGYKYGNLPDIEVYPIFEDKTVEGHSEVWIAIEEEKL